MELDRQSGIPYYVQLKELIRAQIKNGLWVNGTRLPTERDFARTLGVSRNTVSQAYKELEQEGILRSTQGRGTFVADGRIVSQHEGRKDRVLKIIDMAMEEAVGLGFSLNDFISFAHVRAMEKKELLSKIKVGFVECNPEQLNQYQWRLGSGVNILPFLLTTTGEEACRLREQLAAMDVVVTGEQHLPDVQTLLQDISIPVLALSLQPRMETVVRVARLSMKRKIALICHSQRFADEVRKALEKAGLKPDLKILLQPGIEITREELLPCEAVIVCPKFRSVVEKVLPPHMELIEFCFEPDSGSLNFLRSALLDLKKK